MNFKTWKDSKKVKLTDLVFTHALKDSVQQELLERVGNNMAALQPSFSEGLAFLEMATDLILMGHTESLLQPATDFNSWKTQLFQLRYPQTALRDSESRHMFENLPWPHGAKVKFERRGDKSGVELKLFISNPSDLTKILASLERVQQEMNK